MSIDHAFNIFGCFFCCFFDILWSYFFLILLVGGLLVSLMLIHDHIEIDLNRLPSKLNRITFSTGATCTVRLAPGLKEMVLRLVLEKWTKKVLSGHGCIASIGQISFGDDGTSLKNFRSFSLIKREKAACE